MTYEINVSKNGEHLFATNERSLTTESEARRVYAIFVAKFPARDGYKISVTRWERQGEHINFTEGDSTKMRDMFDYVLDTGGGTFTHTGALLSPGSGYAVAIGSQQYVEMADVADLFAAFVGMLCDPKSRDGAYIGCWIDKGRLYVEPSEIRAFADAMALAQTHNQLAIYGFAEGREIYMSEFKSEVSNG
jgi:hypothetical protein